MIKMQVYRKSINEIFPFVISLLLIKCNFLNLISMLRIIIKRGIIFLNVNIDF